jgi:hypothetical protein
VERGIKKGKLMSFLYASSVPSGRGREAVSQGQRKKMHITNITKNSKRQLLLAAHVNGENNYSRRFG